MRKSSLWLFVAFSISLAACASTRGTVPIQRALEGPTADEVWMARFARDYGRAPTFLEQTTWKAAFEEKVNDYLNRHKEILTSPRSSQFRFERRIAIGMTSEEVLLLLGRPDETTSDAPKLATAAGLFWPQISQRAKEMWTYPSGWEVYFADGRVVDLTVLGKAPLE